jgi:hypothetical protein
MGERGGGAGQVPTLNSPGEFTLNHSSKKRRLDWPGVIVRAYPACPT